MANRRLESLGAEAMGILHALYGIGALPPELNGTVERLLKDWNDAAGLPPRPSSDRKAP